MKLRTKGEQKAYLDGYEMCAECIERYLSKDGKKKLECMLMAVRNAVEIEDLAESEDAISRQAVDEYISHLLSDYLYDEERERLEEFSAWLWDELPSVQPEQRTGHWIAYEVQLPDRTILNYRCSVCGRKLIGYNTETLSEAPFCHCGAKMDGGDDNG